jgi:hypothetical protein
MFVEKLHTYIFNFYQYLNLPAALLSSSRPAQRGSFRNRRPGRTNAGVGQDKELQARNTADSDQPYTTNETAVSPQSNTGLPRSQNQRRQPPPVLLPCRDESLPFFIPIAQQQSLI